MARLLINVRHHMHDVIVSMPDDHEFGVMEDYEKYVAKFGSDEGWPGDYVIVDCPEDQENPEKGMTVAEGLAYSDPDVTVKEIDDLDIPGAKRDASIVNHTHAGQIDPDPLERRLPGSGRDTLRTIKKITRDKAAVLAQASLKNGG